MKITRYETCGTDLLHHQPINELWIVEVSAEEHQLADPHTTRPASYHIYTCIDDEDREVKEAYIDKLFEHHEIVESGKVLNQDEAERMINVTRPLRYYIVSLMYNWLRDDIKEAWQAATYSMQVHTGLQHPFNFKDYYDSNLLSMYQMWGQMFEYKVKEFYCDE